MKKIILIFFISINLFAKEESSCFRFQSKAIPIPSSIDSAQISSDGNKILGRSFFSKEVRMIDKETGIENFYLKYDDDTIIRKVEFSEDNSKIIINKTKVGKNNKDEFEIYDTNSGKKINSFVKNNTFGPLYFNRDASLVAACVISNKSFSKTCDVEITNLKTGKSKTLAKSSTSYSHYFGMSFSSDSKYLIGPDRDSFTNLETKEVTKFPKKFGLNRKYIPSSENQFLRADDGNQSIFILVEKAQPYSVLKEFEIQMSGIKNVVTGLKIAQDGDIAFIDVTTSFSDNTLENKKNTYAVNLKNGQVVFKHPSVSCDSKDIQFYHSAENEYYSSLCIENVNDNQYNFIEKKFTCNIKFETPDCDSANCTQKSIKDKNPLKNVTTQLELCKLSKKGSFNLKKDLRKIVEIINGEDYLQYEAELIQLLAGLIVEYADLYEDLIIKFPKLLKLDPQAESKNSLCTQNEVDQKERRLALFKYSESLKLGKFKDLDFLMPLQKIILGMNEKDQDKLKEIIAQKLSDAAMSNPQFEGVSYAKIFRLTSEGVAELFDDEPEAITDLSLVRPKAGKADLMLFSSKDHQLDNEKLNEYGFYHKKINTFKLEKERDASTDFTIHNESYKWKMGDKNFQAKVKLNYKKGGVADIVPKTEAPPYDRLFKNGLNGLVVLGSNIKGSMPKLMDNYLTYYKKEGFNCGGPKDLKKIDDLKKHIKEKIASGYTDYFIKEAHSDGDEKNVFFIDKSASLLKCIHKTKNESVDLIFPNLAEEKTVALKNNELKDIMEERRKNKGSELLFFNTSCWSAKDKAVTEIEAVSSHLLVEIPSLTSVETFTNGKDDAERLLLTSFRNRGSYKDMRSELEKNPKYKNGSDNRFIFPDDENYDNYIRNKLGIPLDIDIKIYDHKKKEYTLDQD